MTIRKIVEAFLLIGIPILIFIYILNSLNSKANEWKYSEPQIQEHHYVIVKDKVMEPAFGSDRNDTYPVLYLKSPTDSNSVGAMAVDQSTFDSVQIGDTLFLTWN